MKKLIKIFKLKQSMSRADDPYDKAWVESLWSRLKAELNMPKGSYESLEQLKTVLFEGLAAVIRVVNLYSNQP